MNYLIYKGEEKMRFLLPAITDMQNESDVEQKLIYPMLVSESPEGLGLSQSHILTKPNIKKLMIDKGNTSQKIYYPDFVILKNQYPIVVIEAKSITEDIMVGYREARLYSGEINSTYPNGINPVSIIISCNGKQLAYGHSDSYDPIDILELSELLPATEKFANLQAFLSPIVLENLCKVLDGKHKPNFKKKPRRMIGGPSIQDEELKKNSFGSTISADFGRIFNPISRDDREYIAKNGYIPSSTRTRYIDPIDKVIRAGYASFHENESTAISDTGNPKEIIGVFKRPNLEQQTLLIIGSVGSGKTTFIDYLELEALPKETVKNTVWARINLNPAPMSEIEIYDWLRKKIIESCKDSLKQFDFDDLSIIRKVFSVEIQRFHKGTIGLIPEGSELYNQKLYSKIQELVNDLDISAKAYSRFCATERGKLLIIVFDNCDKRTKNEQLLMFQAAEWVREQFRAFVILPLRAETYDNFRNLPPLDTTIKDWAFRIEPPTFQAVLTRRVQLALDQASNSKTLRYDLPNGFHVDYAANDQAYYLTTILNSVFTHDAQIRRIITGLSGKNIRLALEIFLEFCNSGHIGEDEIFRIKSNQGKYFLPIHKATQVLLRLNRRYYDGDNSYIKNLFDASKLDDIPFYFTRLMILRWLQIKSRLRGSSSRQKGYFSIGTMKGEFIQLGVSETIFQRELTYLIKAQCIVSEDVNLNNEGLILSDEFLIKLAPAGYVHLDLLNNVTYLAGAAEDTIFTNQQLAQEVVDRIKGAGSKHYAKETVYENAKTLLSFLEEKLNENKFSVSTFSESNQLSELCDISIATDGLSSFETNLLDSQWVHVSKIAKGKGSLAGVITNNDHRYGLFVELEDLNITGLIHKSNLPDDYSTLDEFQREEKINIVIEKVDLFTRKMSLRLCEKM